MKLKEKIYDAAFNSVKKYKKVSFNINKQFRMYVNVYVNYALISSKLFEENYLSNVIDTAEAALAVSLTPLVRWEFDLKSECCVV
jgi:hypothetical protein